MCKRMNQKKSTNSIEIESKTVKNLVTILKKTFIVSLQLLYICITLAMFALHLLLFRLRAPQTLSRALKLIGLLTRDVMLPLTARHAVNYIA